MDIKPIILTLLLPLFINSGGNGSHQDDSKKDLTLSDIESLRELYGDNIQVRGYRHEQEGLEWAAYAWVYGPPEISSKGNCFRTFTATGGKKGEAGRVYWGNFFAAPNRQIQHVIWLQPAGTKEDCLKMNFRTATTMNTAIEEATLIRMNRAIPQMLRALKQESKVFGLDDGLRVPKNSSNYSISSIKILDILARDNIGIYSVTIGDLRGWKNPRYSMGIETGKDGNFVMKSISEINY